MSGVRLQYGLSWRGGWDGWMQEGERGRERQFASDKDLANPLLPLGNARLSIAYVSDALCQKDN